MKYSQFLEDLARLPAMTCEQAAKYYGHEIAVPRVLRSLKAAGLITLTTEFVRERDTFAPIAIIRPDDPAPSAGQIAYRAERLWKDAFSPKVIIRATAALAAMHGSEVRAVAAGQLSHEIALIDVLLRSQQNPDFEWSLVTAKPGAPHPDAIAASGNLLIELVGRYNGSSISAKLALATNATLQLW